ncbi:MAG: DUF2267 domain-containing protein [Candidatus Binatia bacterium]
MDEKGFLGEVARRLHCDERRAESLTFAVFQELHARLTPKEVRDVGAQLPTGLKRLWLGDDRPSRRVERTHREEFVGRVRQWAALPDDDEAERGVRAVFGALQHCLGSPTGREGEAWHIFSQLPKDLKQLWLDAGAQRGE